MANSSKVNLIDPLFTAGSSPPTDRHEELFHKENKGATGSRVRDQTEKGKEIQHSPANKRLHFGETIMATAIEPCTS